MTVPARGLGFLFMLALGEAFGLSVRRAAPVGDRVLGIIVESLLSADFSLPFIALEFKGRVSSDISALLLYIVNNV